jgi:transcription-repair coupling factor (superfamily II helicase)
MLPPGAALALFLAERARGHPAPVVFLARDAQTAHRVSEELAAFLDGELPLLPFPERELLPYDPLAPHPAVAARRMEALWRLPRLERGAVVVSASTALERLPPESFALGRAFVAAVGDRFDLSAERLRLEKAGYRLVPQVEEPGEFAVRGGLIDLFPPGAERPFRIELFDERIDSIRTFDPADQRSLGRVERVELLPAREYPTDPASLRLAWERLLERLPVSPQSKLAQELRAGRAPPGLESYLPLFFPALATLFDYLPAGSELVLDLRFEEAVRSHDTLIAKRYEERKDDPERPPFAPRELFLDPEALAERIAAFPTLSLSDRGPDPRFAPPPALGEGRGVALVQRLLRTAGLRLVLVTPSPGHAENLAEQLAAAGLNPRRITRFEEAQEGSDPLLLWVAPLESGFLDRRYGLLLLTEQDLYPGRALRPRGQRERVRDPESILRDLAELAEGAPVVHSDHGVGRYRGLKRLEVGGAPGDFLAIEYLGGDMLYVPVTQLDRVSRYLGAGAEEAPWHRLGGEEWERARRRAAGKVRDVAAELLALEARRRAASGCAIAVDRAALARFAEGFPFEETPDQAAAIEAVLADLERPEPMDRLVCGDVGFGKTEVALRAACAVALAGQQVALLVPTTLLAQQHYETFRDRFAGWPVRIAQLSRLGGTAALRRELADLAAGQVDIVIGTHRLLQDDVRFARLGLVIVDEEQRFGVRHKERLKALRAEVNLLTLTATPIPRTLNLAFAGVKAMSLIATPPSDRLAVKTLVVPYERAIVREALERELARGGQAYFVHNDIATLEKRAAELEALLPGARFRIAHGKMRERELERVMLDFHRQRFEVLVSTTIIESGIDVPNANTILIDRADRFGLAQLHQLRGRVGRSHHRAYAYLFVPDLRAISTDARKRLEAIAAVEELGAGFALATQDLEIRGAGELLGEEQSGQIEAIGFSLYLEMLERAVAAYRRGEFDERTLLEPDPACRIELGLPAFLPDDYLPDVSERLRLYKRIAAAAGEEALAALAAELRDRFGPLPEPARDLLALTRLRRRAEALGIAKLEFDQRGGRLEFGPAPRIEPARLVALLQREPRRYALEGPQRLRIREAHPEPAARLAAAEALLTALGGGSERIH